MLGGLIGDVFLLFIVLGLVASPGDIGGELRGWAAMFVAWPVLSYVAWRGGSVRDAFGRSSLIAGVLGVVAVPLLAARFPGDAFLLTVGGATMAALALAFVLRRQPVTPRATQRSRRAARHHAKDEHPPTEPHAPSERQRARVVVIGATALGLIALWTEPRRVPVLIAAAVAALYGLWLLQREHPSTSGRTWGVLGAAAVAGPLGLVAIIDLVRSDVPDGIAGFLFIAGDVGPYAVASGLVFALIWPEWWWRWGLILSWGFVVASLTAPSGTFFTRAPILLVLLPCLGAAVGALLHRALPLLPAPLRQVARADQRDHDR